MICPGTLASVCLNAPQEYTYMYTHSSLTYRSEWIIGAVDNKSTVLIIADINDIRVFVIDSCGRTGWIRRNDLREL